MGAKSITAVSATRRMKRQRKYTSREMILKDIDAARRKITRLRHTSQDHREQADLLVTMDNIVRSRLERELAEKLWQQADRMENKRIRKLGATLAMFDTKPLIGDEQVTLQRV
jgi:hypothetical protein